VSYQRWTTGDAYVYGYEIQSTGERGFVCCACELQTDITQPSGYLNHFTTYRGIIAHLETYHTDSEYALETLRAEAEVMGLDGVYPLRDDPNFDRLTEIAIRLNADPARQAKGRVNPR